MREAMIDGIGVDFSCHLGVGVGIVGAVQDARGSIEVPDELKDKPHESYLVFYRYFTGKDLLDFIKENESNSNLYKGTYDRIAPQIELDKFYKVVAFDD